METREPGRCCRGWETLGRRSKRSKRGLLSSTGAAILCGHGSTSLRPQQPNLAPLPLEASIPQGCTPSMRSPGALPLRHRGKPLEQETHPRSGSIPAAGPSSPCVSWRRGWKQRDHPTILFPSSSAGNFGAQHPADRSQACSDNPEPPAGTAQWLWCCHHQKHRGWRVDGGKRRLRLGVRVLVQAEVLSGEKGGGWSVGRWRKHGQGHGWR